jgi:hypothetical protein
MFLQSAAQHTSAYGIRVHYDYYNQYRSILVIIHTTCFKIKGTSPTSLSFLCLLQVMVHHSIWFPFRQSLFRITANPFQFPQTSADLVVSMVSFLVIMLLLLLGFNLLTFLYMSCWKAADAAFLTRLLHITTSEFKTHLHPSFRILPTTIQKVRVTQ